MRPKHFAFWLDISCFLLKRISRRPGQQSGALSDGIERLQTSGGVELKRKMRRSWPASQSKSAGILHAAHAPPAAAIVCGRRRSRNARSHNSGRKERDIWSIPNLIFLLSWFVCALPIIVRMILILHCQKTTWEAFSHFASLSVSLFFSLRNLLTAPAFCSVSNGIRRPAIVLCASRILTHRIRFKGKDCKGQWQKRIN